MDHTARGSIQVEGLEMALIKQHPLETKHKQAESQNLGIWYGENVCGTMEIMWNYGNLGRSF